MEFPPSLPFRGIRGDCWKEWRAGQHHRHIKQESARASQGRDDVEAVRLNAKLLGNYGATSLSQPSHSSSTAGNLKSEVQIEYVLSPNDLALATVPGQDFDPRTRCFSEEELKPQPMIKKSRKQVSQRYPSYFESPPPRGFFIIVSTSSISLIALTNALQTADMFSCCKNFVVAIHTFLCS
ncbi:hypothetical protein SK128_020034 [Halocaridina rubra]|uniref:Uncharacterized protein n=1 Tax=Halocaridina rubra TaxID=373956 RepID=A0AAN9A5F1_HALRR